ncbi:MAG: PIN domain-containing protein [Planctomycetota bacterium]
MSTQRYRIDTNVLLRFLRADHAEHSPAARSVFDAAGAGRCVIVLDAIVLAEAVWVLSSFYKTEREDIASALAGLLVQPGIECADADVLADALDRFAAQNLDFIDCYLAARSVDGGEAIVTFDGEFRKFGDVLALQPGAAAKTN